MLTRALCRRETARARRRCVRWCSNRCPPAENNTRLTAAWGEVCGVRYGILERFKTHRHNSRELRPTRCFVLIAQRRSGTLPHQTRKQPNVAYQSVPGAAGQPAENAPQIQAHRWLSGHQLKEHLCGKRTTGMQQQMPPMINHPPSPAGAQAAAACSACVCVCGVRAQHARGRRRAAASCVCA